MQILNGVDTEKIERIEKSVQNPRFLSRVFTKKERVMFENRRNNTNTITANFCAKEAFLKAVGIGISYIPFTDIEVLRDEKGKPYYNFYGKALEFIEKNGYFTTLSITHTKELATAFVILYKE